jgi:hypothetical protein
MIPDERKLVEKMRDRPFVMVGISADHSAETLRQFVRTQDLPWTHVFDGMDGPLRRLYGVDAFPTIYVLDAKGSIRFSAVGQQQPGRIEQIVQRLLDEGH